MRSSVGAKRRKFWLMAASALASSSVFAASFVLSGFAAAPAQAQVIENPELTVPTDFIPSGATLLVGVNGGTGTVNIIQNGSVTLNALGIGGTEGAATIVSPMALGTGIVNVTGPNANLVVNNQIFVGPTFAAQVVLARAR